MRSFIFFLSVLAASVCYGQATEYCSLKDQPETWRNGCGIHIPAAYRYQPAQNTDKYNGGKPYRITGIEIREYNDFLHQYELLDSTAITWYDNEGSGLPYLELFDPGNYYLEKILDITRYVEQQGQYEAVSALEKIYDNNGLATQMKTYNIYSGQYAPNVVLDYYYDNNDRLIRQEYAYGGGADTSEAYTYLYDSQDRVVQYRVDSYVTGTGWEPFTREEYEYNSAGYRTKNTYSEWNYNTLTMDYYSRNTTGYDGNNHVLYTTETYWNGTAFVPSDSVYYYYNGNNDLDSVYDFQWNGNAWEYEMKTILFYDLQTGDNISAEFYFHNGMQWQKGSREEYQYDNYHNMTVFHRFSVSGNNWNDESREFYWYGSLGEVIKAREEDYSGSWDTVALYSWYWEYDVTTIQEPETIQQKVYPNPASGPVVFNYTVPGNGEFTIRIMDISGREIFSRKSFEVQGQNTFVWDGQSAAGKPLPSGVYLYTMEMDGKFTTGKIVKS